MDKSTNNSTTILIIERDFNANDISWDENPVVSQSHKCLLQEELLNIVDIFIL